MTLFTVVESRCHICKDSEAIKHGTYVRVAWPDGFVREVCDTCWARDTEGMDERLDMEEGDDGD